MSELKHVFVYNKQQTVINFINLITICSKSFLKTNDLALFFLTGWSWTNGTQRWGQSYLMWTSLRFSVICIMSCHVIDDQRTTLHVFLLNYISSKLGHQHTRAPLAAWLSVHIFICLLIWKGKGCLSEILNSTPFIWVVPPPPPFTFTGRKTRWSQHWNISKELN